MSKLDKYLQTGGKVIAEKGEYFKDLSGKIIKIKDAPTHNDNTIVSNITGKKKITIPGKGGVEVLAQSVNSDTHSNRKESDTLYTYKDEEIKIYPEEAYTFGLQQGLSINKPRKPISPAKLIDLTLQRKENFAKKYKNITQGTNDVFSQNSAKLNSLILEQLPSIENIYDQVLDLQESKKSNFEENEYARKGCKKKQQGGKAKLSNYPYMKGSRPALSTSNGKSIEVLDGRTISMDQIYDSDSVVVKGNQGTTFYSNRLKKYIKK